MGIANSGVSRSARRGAAALAGLWILAIPSIAAAEPAPTWDLHGSMKEVKGDSSERTAKITIGNDGPDDFVACREPYCTYDSTYFADDPFIGIAFTVGRNGMDTTDVTTDGDCSINPNNSTGTQFNCYIGRTLPVGQERSVTVSFPSGSGDGDDYISGGVIYKWEGSPSTQGFAEDPDGDNNGDGFVFGDKGPSPACKRAKQKVAKLQKKVGRAPTRAKKQKLQKKLKKAKKAKAKACN